MKLLLNQILRVLFSSMTTAQVQDTWDVGCGVFPFDCTHESSKIRSSVLDFGSFIVNNKKGVHKEAQVLFANNVQQEKHVREGFDELTDFLTVYTSIGRGFAGFKASAAIHYQF